MNNSQVKPMGIGRILDRSFQLYRKHFVKLTLILLILFGPFYLFQNLLLINESSGDVNSLIDGIRTGVPIQDALNDFAGSTEADSLKNIGATLLFLFVLLPLFVLGLMPAAVASVTFLVKAALQGEEIPSVGTLLKRAFRRFWPLAGSTFVTGLILVGIYIGFIIIIILVVLAFTLGLGISQGFGGGQPGGLLIVSGIIFFILIMIGSMIGLSFFVIRWGYFLPFVALGEESIGIGRSWSVTKRSFWRLFFMYVVLSIVLSIFSLIVSMLISLGLGTNLLSQLLQALVSVIIAPLWLLPYAISFFDLRTRNEGMGLEAMIQTTVFGDDPGREQPLMQHPTLEQFRNSQNNSLDQVEQTVNLNKNKEAAPNQGSTTEESDKKND
ncbi:hypothetical protein D3C73_578350 [compost metagenome]